MAERPTRSQVPKELTWDLTGVYPDQAAWEEEIARLDPALVQSFRGRLGEGAEIVLDCLRARDALQEQAGRITFYAHLHQMADSSDPAHQAMVSRAGAVANPTLAAAAFIEPELLSLPEGRLERYAEAPALKGYAGQLRELIRRRPHVLVHEAEAVLAGLSQTLGTPTQLYNHIVNADLRCEPVTDSAGKSHAVSIDRYLWHISTVPDRELRRRGYASLMAGLRRHRNTLGTNLINHIRKQVSLARVRHFGSAAEMMLHPHHLDVAFYRQAVDTLLEEARPVAHQLLRLRKRLWGVDQLYPYDLLAPLVDEGERVSFEQAGDLLRGALAPLGGGYLQVIETALRERWVDRADNQGKFPIPVSTSQYGLHPYVMTTWTDKLSDAMVLGHELGHAVHAVLTGRSQSIGDSRFGMHVAETASTTNEWLCYHHLAAGGDRAKAVQATRYLVEFDFVLLFCTMVLHERLQQRLFDLVEAGKPVSAGLVLQMQNEIWREFYGDELVLEEESQMEWALWPHFYYNTLYPHCYAVAMSASFVIANRMLEEGATAAERYLTVLRAGGTLPPIQFWRTAGVEMETDEPFRQAVRYFGRLVEELTVTLAGERS